MWFSMVCTIINNDTSYHGGQNSVGVTRLRVLSPQNFDHCDDAYSSIREQTTLNHIRFVNLTPKAEQHDFGTRGNADADTKREKTRAADSQIGGNQKRTPKKLPKLHKMNK